MARDYEATVKALLIKAYSHEDENHPERIACEAKAFEIMSEHSITVALEAPVSDEQVVKYSRFGNPYGAQKRRLYATLTRHFNGQLLRDNDDVCIFFGYRSDYDSTEFLYSILINQAMKELSVLNVPSHIHAKAYKTSWWLGFTSKISQRLRESRKEAEKNSVPGAALALINRAQVSENEMHKMFPRTRSLQSSRISSMAGFNSGQEAASKAVFHNQGSVNNGRLALGG